MAGVDTKEKKQSQGNVFCFITLIKQETYSTVVLSRCLNVCAGFLWLVSNHFIMLFL